MAKNEAVRITSETREQQLEAELQTVRGHLASAQADVQAARNSRARLWDAVEVLDRENTNAAMQIQQLAKESSSVAMRLALEATARSIGQARASAVQIFREVPR